MRPAAGLGLLAALSLMACLFETRPVEEREPGFASLELRLRPNPNALLKSAANPDTIFRLDSLIIQMSAPGAATTTAGYAISGRADTGNIAVAAKVFTLAPLRTWKARILTLDTAGATGVDTVHLDSVSFSVKPGDTTFVSKTVSPRYAILRVRLVSNSPDDIDNPVKFVRIRVDGTTRDSTPVGPNLRSVDFGNGTTGIAVGDSGTLLRTTNGGLNWTPASGGGAADLKGVHMPATNTGYAVGEGGAVLKTTTGTSWNAITSGTSENLNATYWRSTSTGWVVGDRGTIRKSTNGSSFSAQPSGTSRDLNGVCFTSNNNGVAVGDSGLILRTTNGGSGWSTRSSGTNRDLKAVHFPSSSIGYAVGSGGVILKTTNGGSSWSPLASGTEADLTGVFFTSNTEGMVVGAGGVVLTTANGSSWTDRDGGTTQDLYGAGWTTNSKSGVAIGAAGAVCYTTTGAGFTFRPYGTKSFDVVMAYKYFTPDVAHTLVMEAIDTLAGALRGYQVSKTILLAPGKDTTVTPNPSLARCGYNGTAACSP